MKRILHIVLNIEQMNLSQVVQHEIQSSAFILEAMHAEIVNISSLARFLQPVIVRKMNQDVSIGALSMAIKRLPIAAQMQAEKSISKFMTQLGDITVRSDLADFSYRNSDTLIECQARLLAYLKTDKRYFYSMCKGVDETTLVCSTSLSSRVQEIFSKETTIITRTGLAAVSVKLPTTNLDTYGVYYTILKRLAWRGINIVEVISTSHEISLIISNEDVEEVFAQVLSLKHQR